MRPRFQVRIACEIAGVLHVGENVARARSGRAFYYRPAPYALMVEVVEAGELHIYQGGIRLISIKAGHLQNEIAYSVLDFLPISSILMSGESALPRRMAYMTPSARPPTGAPTSNCSACGSSTKRRAVRATGSGHCASLAWRKKSMGAPSVSVCVTLR